MLERGEYFLVRQENSAKHGTRDKILILKKEVQQTPKISFYTVGPLLCQEGEKRRRYTQNDFYYIFALMKNLDKRKCKFRIKVIFGLTF